MYNSNQISEKIKILAKSKGISQKQMLEKAGLSYNFMSGLNKSVPNVASLDRIANVLDCTVDELIGRTENHAPSAEPTDHRLTEAVERLNPQGVEMVIQHALFLATQPEYKKDDSVQKEA